MSGLAAGLARAGGALRRSRCARRARRAAALPRFLPRAPARLDATHSRRGCRSWPPLAGGLVGRHRPARRGGAAAVGLAARAVRRATARGSVEAAAMHEQLVDAVADARVGAARRPFDPAGARYAADEAEPPSSTDSLARGRSSRDSGVRSMKRWSMGSRRRAGTTRLWWRAPSGSIGERAVTYRWSRPGRRYRSANGSPRAARGASPHRAGPPFRNNPRGAADRVLRCPVAHVTG